MLDFLILHFFLWGVVIWKNFGKLFFRHSPPINNNYDGILNHILDSFQEMDGGSADESDDGSADESDDGSADESDDGSADEANGDTVSVKPIESHSEADAKPSKSLVMKTVKRSKKDDTGPNNKQKGGDKTTVSQELYDLCNLDNDPLS